MHKYRLISKKGEGTFSEVLKAQSIKNGKHLAIKCMKLDQIQKIHNVLGTPSASVLNKFRKFATHIDLNFPPKEGTGIRKLIPYVSDDCIDIIEKLLAYDPEERLSARHALKHPYFKEIIQSHKNKEDSKSSKSKDRSYAEDGRDRRSNRSDQHGHHRKHREHRRKNRKYETVKEREERKERERRKDRERRERKERERKERERAERDRKDRERIEREEERARRDRERKEKERAAKKEKQRLREKQRQMLLEEKENLAKGLKSGSDKGHSSKEHKESESKETSSKSTKYSSKSSSSTDTTDKSSKSALPSISYGDKSWKSENSSMTTRSDLSNTSRTHFSSSTLRKSEKDGKTHTKSKVNSKISHRHALKQVAGSKMGSSKNHNLINVNPYLKSKAYQAHNEALPPITMKAKGLLVSGQDNSRSNYHKSHYSKYKNPSQNRRRAPKNFSRYGKSSKKNVYRNYYPNAKSKIYQGQKSTDNYYVPHKSKISQSYYGVNSLQRRQ
eukprot:g1140.t1